MLGKGRQGLLVVLLLAALLLLCIRLLSQCNDQLRVDFDELLVLRRDCVEEGIVEQLSRRGTRRRFCDQFADERLRGFVLDVIQTLGQLSL